MLKESDEALYKLVKMRMDIEHKSIKFHNFYNFLNDGVSNLIIDCRTSQDDEYSKQGRKLVNSYDLKIFSFDDYKEQKSSHFIRLILIIDDKCDIKTDTALENLRSFIKDYNNINSIYTIFNENFINFQAKFSFYFLNEYSAIELDKTIANSNFPLMILDNTVFLGNYLNSKNKFQLELLGIKTIISLLKEKDDLLESNFDNYNFFESDEPNHGTIDFLEIVDCAIENINQNNSPILVYCFSGQTISIAVCIALLMKYKNWSLMLSTAYMMKIIPEFKIPPWLYSQLNKFSTNG